MGLHQTTSYGNGSAADRAFEKPTLTYCAPDMGARIAQLKAKGCTFAVELPNDEGQVITAVLETPGGEPVFLVQGEVESAE